MSSKIIFLCEKQGWLNFRLIFSLAFSSSKQQTYIKCARKKMKNKRGNGGSKLDSFFRRRHLIRKSRGDFISYRNN